MFFLINFLTKVANLYGGFLGCFEKVTVAVKTSVPTFWATFGKFGLLFILLSGHTVQDHQMRTLSPLC